MPTLNPSIITGNLPKMPQITGRATTSGSGIDLSTLDPSIYSGSGLTSGSGFNWSSVLNALNGFAGSPLGQGIGSLGTSIINNLFDNYRAKQQREWNEQMMDKQNAFSLDMWNKTNEYNSPAAQKQRLIDAGLNPLYYGLDGTSANSFESAQPLSYERSTMPLLSNPMPAMLDAQVKQAQINNINATTDKIKSETIGVDLDNDFKVKSNDLKVEGIKLANEATKEQIEYTKVQRSKGLAEIDKIIEETKTESERRTLIVLQQAVQRATEKQILELLPYQKNLMSAQAANQRAQATAAEAKAMIDKGLFEQGYVEKTIEELTAQITKEKNISDKEQQAAIAAKIKNMMLKGEWLSSSEASTEFGKSCSEVFDKFISAMMMLQVCFPVKIGGQM